MIRKFITICLSVIVISDFSIAETRDSDLEDGKLYLGSRIGEAQAYAMTKQTKKITCSPKVVGPGDWINVYFGFPHDHHFLLLTPHSMVGLGNDIWSEEKIINGTEYGVVGYISGETNYVAESHHKYPMVSINVDDLYFGGSRSWRKNDRIFETEGEYEFMTVPWGDYNPVEGDLTPGPSCKVYFKGRK